MNAWSVPHTALAARTCVRIGPDDPSPWRGLRTQPVMIGLERRGVALAGLTIGLVAVLPIHLWSWVFS